MIGRIKQEMKVKKFFSAIIVLAAVLAYGGDYGTALREAGDAMKEKNFAVAEAKYAEAVAASKDSKQKCDAVLGKYQAMRRQGKQKIKESETFVTEALEDEIEIAHVILTDYNDDPEMTEETTFFSEEDYVEYERLILQLKEFIDSRK